MAPATGLRWFFAGRLLLKVLEVRFLGFQWRVDEEVSEIKKKRLVLGVVVFDELHGPVGQEIG